MAYVADWISRVIFIPISGMTLVQGTEYDLSMDSFWKEVRRLEADPQEGLWAPQVLNHVVIPELSGTTQQPLDEVINGYTFEFDPQATRVDLRGSNTNLADSGIVVPNGVVVIPHNSAGNTVTFVNAASVVTAQDKTDIIEGVVKYSLAGLTDSSTLGGYIVKKLLTFIKFQQHK